MNIQEVLNKSLEERKEIFNNAKVAYYESDSPIMSDVDYDLLEESIITDSPDDMFIGVNSRHNKAEHRNKMLSLKKHNINIDGSDTDSVLLEAFNKLGGGRYTLGLSMKYDGLAVDVDFENRTLKQIATRGDGSMGVNRTNKLRHIIDNDPSWQMLFDKFVTGNVRCECIVDYPTFEEHYIDSGKKHPRNVASGLVGDENLEAGVGHLRLVALEGIDSIGLIITSRTLDMYLTDVRNEINNIETYEDLKQAFQSFKEHRQDFIEPTDGLVLSKSSTNMEFKHDGKYPEHALCIKFSSPNFKATVTDIEWNLQKTGRYVPKVYFTPITVDGRDIVKASGHNLDWLVRNNIKVGEEITIQLSGDIIPYILTDV